jgi:hypothetical protein
MPLNWTMENIINLGWNKIKRIRSLDSFAVDASRRDCKKCPVHFSEHLFFKQTGHFLQRAPC